MHVRRFYVSSPIPKKQARLVPAPHSVSFPPSLLVTFVARIGSSWQRDQKSAAAQIHSQNSKKLLRVASFREKKICKDCWTVPNIKDSKCQKEPQSFLFHVHNRLGFHMETYSYSTAFVGLGPILFPVTERPSDNKLGASVPAGSFPERLGKNLESKA